MALTRNSLREDFDVTEKVLGTEIFARLAREYLDAHPPQGHTLAGIAENFPAFIRDQVAKGSSGLPAFVSDLVRVEWQMCELRHSIDPGTWDPSSVSSLPEEEWPNVKLQLKPLAHVMDVEWPIDELWEDAGKSLEKCPTTLCLHRNEGSVFVRSVDENEAELLRMLAAGTTLGEVGGWAEEKGLAPEEFSDYWTLLQEQSLITGIL